MAFMGSDKRASSYWLLVAPLLVLVAAFYIGPVANILWLGFTDPAPGLGNYEKLVTSTSLAKILWTTLRICVLTTVLSVAVGYVIAYAMSHLGGRERRWMLTLVLVSFWVSVLVRAFAWLTLLGRNGLINGLLTGSGLADEPLALVRNELGVLVGMVHYMIPYAVLPLLANMQGIDQRVVKASRSLGAGPVRTFARIYLPLTAPGIMASSLLVFIISLGFYVTPAILGGGRVLMVAEYISVQVLVTVQWGTASMLATLLLLGVFALLFILSRFMKIKEVFGAPA
jgi:putative spermidine/putrescine transport system permease protein